MDRYFFIIIEWYRKC